MLTESSQKSEVHSKFVKINRLQLRFTIMQYHTPNQDLGESLAVN